MGITLFKRPASPRKESREPDFAATVATLPPGAEAAVPLPAAGSESQALDSLPPDSLTFDSQPFDSQPFDSQPFDSQPPDLLPADSQAPDSRPPDLTADEDSASKVPADPFEPHPPQELPPYLGGPTPKSNPAAANEAPPPAIDESALPMADQPTIAQVGRYALKRHLGLGGLGQVHEAWDPLLSRTVAIKTLQFESDPRTRNSLDRLFLNEARAVAGLSHPNIVTVYDAGLSPQGVYLAMERLQGKDLRQRLAEGWKPGPAVVAQLVRRVADALAYAHARGVVHCDIKPGNIYITGHDKPKVLDFGIARVAHRRAIPALEGMVAGSPYYLAPEQLLDKDVDARTDVYSLGVVFYELLSGRRAFGGDSVEQITTAVLTNHPAPAHLIRSGVPEALSAVAARAMARDPEARYASASEMSADIRNWFDQPRTPTPTRQARAEARRLKQATTKPTPRRWPWAVAGASVAVLAMVSVGLLWALRPVARPGPATAEAGATAPAGNTGSAAPGVTPAAGAPRETEFMMSGGVPVVATAAAGAAPAANANTAVAAPAAGATVSTPTAAVPDGPTAAAAAPAVAATRPEPATVTRVAATAPQRGGTAAAAARDAGPTRKPAQPGTAAATGAAAAASGTVQFAISPWGQIEVDGQAAGTTPPLTQLSLPTGTHAITVRNADFPPFTATIQVQADKPTVVRHRFGQ